MKLDRPAIETTLTLRPSSASRWLTCEGSALLEPNYESQISFDTMVLTTQGTAAHELLERCMLEDTRADMYLGEMIEVIEPTLLFPISHQVDHEMVDAVNLFLDEVHPYKHGRHIFCEQWMQHSKVPELSGTSDVVMIDEMDGYIFDLKYGSAAVQAQKRNGDKNPQLMCYASMLFDNVSGIQTVYASIIQPRLKTKKKVRTVSIDRYEAEEFMDRVGGIASRLRTAVKHPTLSVLSEGSHCYFCNARNACPEKSRNQIERDFG